MRRESTRIDAETKQQAAAQELQARRGAKKSLLEFCSFTLPRFQSNWHLEFLAAELELVALRKTKRLMVFMPPRHGKSEMVSVRFPAWFLGNYPQAQVIGCSYGGSLAHNFSRACRSVIQGEAYQRLWQRKFITDADTHWMMHGKENGRNNYIAAGVGGGISGEGADLLIIDDPVKNAEEADSFVIREKQWEWYKTTARTRLQPGGAIVVVQTRWHTDDLSGKLIKHMMTDPKADQWKIILLPAVNSDNYCVPSKIGKYEALWPDMFGAYDLENIKSTVGPRVWNALYQQRPTSKEGNVWQRDWFQFYRIKDIPKNFDEMMWSWDMTFKDKKSSDFVVGQLWGKIGSRKYLLKQVRERMDFTKTCDKVLETALWEPRAYKKLIEDRANGPAVISALKEKVEGLTPIPKQGSKEACWAAATPDFAAKDVFVPHPDEQPWIHDFIDELCSVPEGALHDDQADAAAQAINHWRSSFRSRVVEIRL